MATYEIGKVQVDQLTEPAGGPTSSFGDTVTAPGLDAPASSALLIGTINATGMTIGHTGVTVNHNAASSIFTGVVDIGFLKTSGATSVNITSVVDVDYTVIATDYFIQYTLITANRNVTLPAASSNPGRIIYISDAYGWGNSFDRFIGILPASGTVNGTSGYDLLDTNGTIAFIADGTDWKILQPDSAFFFGSTSNINLSNRHLASINVATASSGNNGTGLSVSGGNGNGTNKNGGGLQLFGGSGSGGGSAGAIGLVGQSGGYISIADGFFGGSVVNIGLGQAGSQVQVGGSLVVIQSSTFEGATNRFNTGTTSSEQLALYMNSPGTAGTRDSHWFQIRGASFDTGPHTTDWREYVNITSNAGTSTWRLQSRIDAGSFTDRFTVTDAGNATFAGQVVTTNIYGTTTTGGAIRIQANTVDGTSGDIVLQNNNLYLEAGGHTSWHNNATQTTIYAGGHTIMDIVGTTGGALNIDPFDSTGTLNLCNGANATVSIGGSIGVGTLNVQHQTNLKGGYTLGGYGGSPTPFGDIVTYARYRSGAFEEWVAGSAPSAPSSGNFRIYWSSSDKLMHYVDSSSVDYAIPSISANANDFQLTTTSATTIATYTPPVQGNYKIDIYYRVVTATTNVTITLTWTDGSGAQTSNIIPLTSTSVGSYIVPPTYINSTAAAITVTATSGTANNLYVSASVTGA